MTHHDAPRGEVAAATGARPRRPLLFLGLLMVVTLPFYGLLAFDIPMPFDLPPTLVTIVLPAIVATMMVAVEAGSSGIKRLWASLNPRLARKPRAWLAAFLLVPIAGVLDWLLRTWWGVGGAPEGPLTPWAMAPVYLLAFVVGAIPEEIGWSGYASGPLARRRGILAAGAIIGLVWSAWHWIPYVVEGRGLEWIVGQTLLTIGFRILMVWVFVRGGGTTLLACVIHALTNVLSLYPSGFAESHPWTQLLALVIAAAAFFGVVRLVDVRRGRVAQAQN
ncbi:CPBP family intramembrane glutamic endopeptidase [Agromyces sp. NPDC049794]|uniref:CPBP family intramembrane glutamic endopeptidase n=1 Tax=unclassified Agromyces TaxID=2639701 RepID=UPI0033D6EB55